MFFFFFNFFFFFLLQSPCINLPCKNNGKCISLNKTNSYVCACKKIFTGKHCENCKETAKKTIWRERSSCYGSCAHGQGLLFLRLRADEANGQFNGKWPFNLVYELKPLKTAIRSIDDHISLWPLGIWLANCIFTQLLEMNPVLRVNKYKKKKKKKNI